MRSFSRSRNGRDRILPRVDNQNKLAKTVNMTLSSLEESLSLPPILWTHLATMQKLILTLEALLLEGRTLQHQVEAQKVTWIAEVNIGRKSLL